MNDIKMIKNINFINEKGKADLIKSIFLEVIAIDASSRENHIFAN